MGREIKERLRKGKGGCRGLGKKGEADGSVKKWQCDFMKVTETEERLIELEKGRKGWN